MSEDNTDFEKTIFPQLAKLQGFENIQIKWIDKLESEFLRRVREFAPKRTGSYSRSWKTKEKSQERIVFWTTMPNLYVILEFGTRGHEILPNEKRVLRFVDQSGRVVFTMRVEHPGTAPRPHARTALEDTVRDAIDILFGILKQEMPWLQQA